MKQGNSRKKNTVQHCRLFIQIAGLVLTVAGMFLLLRTMGLPRWAFTGTVVVAGLFFCGWVCPFGTVQEWLRYFGKHVLGVSLPIPKAVDRYLLWSRYILAGLALAGILTVAALDSRRAFVMTVTGKGVAIAAGIVLGVLLVLSVFIDRPFCKYLCGFGAVFGVYSIPRLIAIKRSGSLCVQCNACTKSCGMGVEVAGAHTVRDPNCINCGKCLAACPVPGALKVGVALPCRADARALRNKYIPTRMPHDTCGADAVTTPAEDQSTGQSGT